MTLPVIDPWVNVSMGEHADVPFLQAVKRDYFKAGDDFFRNIESGELIEEMDRLGVEKALVTVDATGVTLEVLSRSLTTAPSVRVAASSCSFMPAAR